MNYRRYPKYRARQYQCAIFPWLKARHIHHTAYGGPERLWLDLLPVSVTAHWLIHGVAGGSVWMQKAVTRQNKMARRLPMSQVWQYPNMLQCLLHLWGRLPAILKGALTVMAVGLIGFSLLLPSV